jgi:hypothetical protein
MDTTTFDRETIERLERIRQNPHPRSFIAKARSVLAWIRAIDRRRAFEAFRTTFGILGAAGYAGELATMHVFLAVFSLSLIGATWYGVYLLMERFR